MTLQNDMIIHTMCVWKQFNCVFKQTGSVCVTASSASAVEFMNPCADNTILCRQSQMAGHFGFSYQLLHQSETLGMINGVTARSCWWDWFCGVVICCLMS